MQNILVLGATGSIGLSTLDVIARHPNQYSAYALVANRSVEAMVELCKQHNPSHAVMFDADAAAKLERRLDGLVDTQVHARVAHCYCLSTASITPCFSASLLTFRRDLRWDASRRFF